MSYEMPVSCNFPKNLLILVWGFLSNSYLIGSSSNHASDRDALFQDACLLKLSSKLDLAHEKLLVCAKNNHPIACRMVGQNYLFGKGTFRNRLKAIHWFKKGAFLGDLPSIKRLCSFSIESNQLVQAHAWELTYDKIMSTSKEVLANNEIIENEISLSDDGIKEANRLSQFYTQVINESLLNKINKKEKSYQSVLMENGDKYVGMTLNQIPHGTGKRTSSNGSYYIGDFTNGIETGYGRWFDQNGILIKQGVWKNGKPVFERK